MVRAITHLVKKVEGSLNQLRLDPLNVRFKHLNKMLSDKEIEEIIWKEDATKDLYSSVLATGGLEESIIIDSNNVVKEGNRRLVVLRKLSEKAHRKELGDIPEDKFDFVPCLQLPPDVKPAEINVYLLTVHVRGKKRWFAINKAAHVYDMHERDNLSYDKIRDYVGGTKAMLIRYVDAYKATKRYLKKYPSDKAGIFRFSYFDELYKKPALRQWLSSEPLAMDTFIKWVATGKFREAKQVRQLPEVLKNAEAFSVLNSKNIDEALKVLAKYDPTVGSYTFKTISDALEALQDMPRHELLALHKEKHKRELLQKLHDEAADILKNL